MADNLDDISSKRAARRAVERGRRRTRLTRAAVVAGVVVAVVAVIAALASGGGDRLPAGAGVVGKPSPGPAAGLVYAPGGRLPAPVQDPAAAALPDGRVVLLGGLDRAGRSTDAISIISGGRAAPAGRLPGIQHDAAAATLDGAVYVFGGGDQAQYDHILRYDPTSRAVTAAGRLPRPSSDVAVAAIGRTAYIVGGYDGRRSSASILSWTPGGPAREVGRLPFGVRYAAVTAVDGRLVIAGGTIGATAGRTIFSFDPAARAVRVLGRLPAGRTHAAAAVLGGRVYVIGGHGSGLGTTSPTIVAIDPSSGRTAKAGRLERPLSDQAAVATAGGVLIAGGRDLSAARAEFGVVRPGVARSASVSRAITTGAAVPGYILVADRGNNRIVVLSTDGRVVWRFPTAADLRRGQRLFFNDDTFVVPGGRQLIANEEENHAIVTVDIGTHTVHVLYGHPRVKGARPGYLNTPDDAYTLPDGRTTVADAYNCRILFLRAGRIVQQIGRAGVCRHHPPASLNAVNGDTPTPDGGVLVSEIGGSWVDKFDARGRLQFAFRAPVRYPSDPQPLPGGRILLADYARPGAVLIVDHRGHTLWRYAPSSGSGRLDHPSLALMLPNGNIAVNDDFRHRVVVISPRLGRIVWQYGVTDRPGTGPGRLNTPDGMDFVPADTRGRLDWAAVTHP